MKKIIVDPANWQQEPGYQRNVLLTGTDLSCPGTRVQIVTMEPGDTISRHYHKHSFEVYCVLGGQCELIVNEEALNLHSGMLLMIEPADVHRLHNHGQEVFELLVFKTNAVPSDTFWKIQ